MSTEDLRSSQEMNILPLKYSCKNLNSKQKTILVLYQNRNICHSSTPTAIAHIIKKDRFKMAAVVGLSTSLSRYFVRMECI